MPEVTSALTLTASSSSCSRFDGEMAAAGKGRGSGCVPRDERTLEPARHLRTLLNSFPIEGKILIVAASESVSANRSRPDLLKENGRVVSPTRTVGVWGRDYSRELDYARTLLCRLALLCCQQSRKSFRVNGKICAGINACAYVRVYTAARGARKIRLRMHTKLDLLSCYIYRL